MGSLDLAHAPAVPAAKVMASMRHNFPPKALTWLRDATWVGPVEVPQDRVDYDDVDSWAASHEEHRVKRFAKELRKDPRSVRPAVLVHVPGSSTLKVVDGHHRTLAEKRNGDSVTAYVGTVPTGDDRWQETHSSQLAQGADPANKAAAGPIAAGLAVRAADTGRVLMLQRLLTDDDPAGGFWEFPGGKLDDGETPLAAARREWSEETGCTVPKGTITGTWEVDPYQGFVLSIPHEATVDIHGDRDAVTNPDDPDGDGRESLAWWAPKHLGDSPPLRPELADDWKKVRKALKTASVNKATAVSVMKVAAGTYRGGELVNLTAGEIDAAGTVGFMPVDVEKAAFLHRLGSSSDPAVRDFAATEIVKVSEGGVGDAKARHLIDWYNSGADGQIPWGADGDWDACVAVAGRHMDPAKAKGFCNLRHKDVLGIYPATHAAAARHAEGRKAAYADVIKVGPHGYIHGWIKVAPGGDLHDDNARTLVEHTKLHGGASVHPHTGSIPLSGYMVADKDGSHVVRAEHFYGEHGPDMLKAYVRHHADKFHDPNTYLGTWHDQDSGNVFLDISHHVGNRRQAVDLGKRHDQIAIWDVKNQREIPTGGTGGIEKSSSGKSSSDKIHPLMDKAPGVSATMEYAKHMARQGKRLDGKPSKSKS